METASVCPCCDNHCPVEKLSCVRGMAHFGKPVTEEWLLHHERRGPKPLPPDASTADKVVAAIQSCGRALHHGSGSAEALLSDLSETEQLQLLQLLEKCQQGLKRPADHT